MKKLKIPTVAVLIPAYNVEKYILECIDSLKKNDSALFELEIIVVDDGSTDGTKEIIKSNYDDVKLISKINGGQSSARNLALKNTKADFIMFLDADDMVSNDLIYSCLSVFDSHDVDLVCFDSDVFFDGDMLDENKYNGRNYQRPHNYYNKPIKAIEYFTGCIQAGCYNVSPCMYLIRSKSMKNIEFKEGVIYEDNLFTTELLFNKSVNNIFCLNKKLYHRRYRSNSTVTEDKSVMHFTSYLSVFDELANKLNIHNGVSEYHHFCGNILTLTAKVISEIKNISFYNKMKMKMKIISRVYKYPTVFRPRLLLSLCLGNGYIKLVFFIKNRKS